MDIKKAHLVWDKVFILSFSKKKKKKKFIKKKKSFYNKTLKEYIFILIILCEFF